jgi:hypothetical protein
MPRVIEQEEVGTLASRRNTTTDASTMLTSGSEVIPTTSSFVFCSQSIADIRNINNANGTGNHIPKEWILLDNQSTIDVFSNALLLSNIRTSDTWMKIHLTGGIIHTNMIGDLAGYGPVWFYKAGIANILSLAHLCQQGYIIIYSNINGNTFNVIKSDGTERMFKQSDNRLFLWTPSVIKTVEFL